MEGENWNNDLNMYTCGYTKAVDYKRWDDNEVYASKWFLVDLMKSAYKDVFNLTDNQVTGMGFDDAYSYSDAIFS